MPEDFFPTELDYRDSGENIDNMPMITPYESAVMSTYGPEDDFKDTSAAYESEAGYLQGLGQESGSTGGWFTDLVPQLTKAYVDIAATKAAAKRGAGFPAMPPGGYKTAGGFGAGFNLNTALMIGALGLGGFLLYSKFARKRR